MEQLRAEKEVIKSRLRRDTKMTTAVVVATVVETNMSESAFRQAVLDQIRDNEQNLLATVAGADGDANIVTAILNVEEFMKYMLQRFPRSADAGSSTVAPAPALKSMHKPAQQTTHKPTHKTTVVTDAMSEIEFMNHILDQVEAGAQLPTARFSGQEYDALDDEAVGEHFGRNPFLY
jgi:hypothetical protein